MKYTFHEVGDLFPLMHGEKFAHLVEDIREHGLREAIWLYEDKIIDGRNRYRVCEAAGVEPKFREWDREGSLVAFVLSLNLHRRQLTPSQEARVEAEAVPLCEKEARERQSHGQAAQGKTLVERFSEASHKASEDAARAVGVSARAIERGKMVIEQGTSEVATAAGEELTSTAHAEQVVSASPEFQEAIARLKGR
jgi:ParB-like chromosome segregation protein Spo0J